MSSSTQGRANQSGNARNRHRTKTREGRSISVYVIRVHNTTHTNTPSEQELGRKWNIGCLRCSWSAATSSVGRMSGRSENVGLSYSEVCVGCCCCCSARNTPRTRRSPTRKPTMTSCWQLHKHKKQLFDDSEYPTHSTHRLISSISTLQLTTHRPSLTDNYKLIAS